MSPEARRPVIDPFHEQARLLAAAALDEPLAPSDAAHLAAHLADCPDCAAAASDFAAVRAELRSLRAPEPPRDLWARTSAALDAVEGRVGRTGARAGTSRRAPTAPLLGSAIAVVAVMVVAGATILSQGAAGPGPGSTRTAGIAVASGTLPSASAGPQAQLAFVNGTSYWIASTGGVYQIMGGSADCAVNGGTCTVAGGSGKTLGSISSDAQVAAVLDPGATRAVVWTADKVAVVPLSTTPQTVALDLLTPRPLATATAAATAMPTTASATTTPETPTASVESAATTAQPSASVAVPATATTVATAFATSVTAATSPTAILDGYEIVGRDPEFSADGKVVAFAARPVDHSTGPDVFVWRVGDERAHAVTTRHSATFSGWSGARILIGEFAAGSSGTAPVAATSYLYDPSNGVALRIDRPMLVAGIDPTGTYIVYWAGAVEFDNASGIWRAGRGELYFDRIDNLALTETSFSAVSGASAAPSVSTPPREDPSAEATAADATAGPIESPASTETPVASPPATATPAPVQSAAPRIVPVQGAAASVKRWVVRWDSTGSNVAVWTAASANAPSGWLALFSVDAAGALVQRLTVEAVLPTVCFDGAKLVYTSADGSTYMKPLPVAPTAEPTGPTVESTVTPEATASIIPTNVPADSSTQPGA